MFGWQVNFAANSLGIFVSMFFANICRKGQTPEGEPRSPVPLVGSAEILALPAPHLAGSLEPYSLVGEETKSPYVRRWLRPGARRDR